MRVVGRLAAARGGAANCHPQNCNRVYELELNCSSQDDKGTTRQKINQMSIIFMAEVGGSRQGPRLTSKSKWVGEPD